MNASVDIRAQWRVDKGKEDSVWKIRECVIETGMNYQYYYFMNSDG